MTTASNVTSTWKVQTLEFNLRGIRFFNGKTDLTRGNNCNLDNFQKMIQHHQKLNSGECIYSIRSYSAQPTVQIQLWGRIDPPTSCKARFCLAHEFLLGLHTSMGNGQDNYAPSLTASQDPINIPHATPAQKCIQQSTVIAVKICSLCSLTKWWEEENKGVEPKVTMRINKH